MLLFLFAVVCFCFKFGLVVCVLVFCVFVALLGYDLCFGYLETCLYDVV